MRVIATLPPYVEHRAEIIAHPRVDELRFNSVSPLAEPKEDLLKRLARECGGKRLWVDLKGRQLRVSKFAYLPFAYVEINHRVRVNVPTEVLFGDGSARVDAVVDEHKLILSERPWRVLGDGEPLNILDPSLEVLDPLPERDVEFLSAARSAGLHHYMLSFVETEDDVARVVAQDPEAVVMSKIESRRGMAMVRPGARLMAARGDLFIQLGTDTLAALREIVAADPDAVVASRLLESLLQDETPSLPDLSDLALMQSMGYHTLMLGDEVCFRRQAFWRVMEVLQRLL